ncbi:MAG TPA: AAA family ATPase [Candidatus Limnocylindrales bacterium]|nr:AAA family ATPase [Candidatus Limnocylindrales bacterium]
MSARERLSLSAEEAPASPGGSDGGRADIAALSIAAGGFRASRPDLVRRRALLRRVLGAAVPQVTVITAPAGSGKTTFLSQWAADEPRPVAWVTYLPGHADPMLLVHDTARAIADVLGAGPVADVLPRLLGNDPLRNLARLTRALAQEPRPALVILDDVHVVRTHSSAVDLITALIDHAPAGWSFALAGRQAVAAPLARWSLRPEPIVRIEMPDLMLDADECGQLLQSLGLAASEDLVSHVLARTEGWPVGVYLAGLSLRSERGLGEDLLVAGDDGLIRSYLETEILAGIDGHDRDLMLRTSIVREVTGPLAERITGDPEAGSRLYELSRTNLLVMAVDRRERWFRYHGLLADLLQRELEDSDIDRRELHGRAATWFEGADDVDSAIRHASAAGDDARVRRLVLSSFQREYREGRLATVRGWLDIVAQTPLGWDASLALAAAIVAALVGDTAALARATAAAGLDDPDDDLDSERLDRAGMRALLCANGPERMRDDARLALERHDEGWPWAPLAWLCLGSAERMLGNIDAAVAAWEASDRTAYGPRAVARLVTRAERALTAMAERRWAEAEAILQVDRTFAMDILDSGQFPGMLWLVADARLRVRRGDLRGAHERLRRAQLARVHLSWGVPWFAVRALTEMARVQLLVGDVGGARTSLAQARDVLRSRPQLGSLEAELEEVAAQAMRSPDTGPRGSTLSPAELRLLPLLQTYLSFKEIGERLSISANTVKTEAMSIYGKLGASTRSEAVELAVAAGLLEDSLP